VTETEFLNTRDNLKIATAAHSGNQPNTQFAKQVRNVEKYLEKQVEVRKESRISLIFVIQGLGILMLVLCSYM